MFKKHYFSLGALSPHRWLTSVASIFFLVSWLWAGQAQAQVPTITSFSPLSAKPADAVTITGTNFNTTAANNIVFFGATKANVTAATATSLTVTVPTGATYAPITVLNTGTTLAAYSKANFNPIYSPAKTAITTSDFSPKQDFPTGTRPISVAIGDLDGDGKPDLAVANYTSNSVSVLRNTSTSGSIGSGSFAAKEDFATGTRPISVAIGDLDGDGKPDLAVANYISNTVSVLRNTSTSGSITSGSFAAKEDFATGTTPISVAIGDLDGDGKPDLAVANFGTGVNTVSVLRNTSTSGSITSGSFAAKEDFATGTTPSSVAIGDLDGDGKPDLAVANYDVNTVSVLRNTSTSGSIGSGSFAAKVDFATGTGPYSVAIGDLDGDGKPDLAVANYNVNTVSVLRNTSTSGSTSFATKVDFATGTSPNSVAIGDLDGDGKPDLAVANYLGNKVSVLRNTSTSGSIGSGSFAAKVDFATGTSPRSVAIGDLDGDGKPDLAVANYNANTVSVLRNADIVPTITSFSPLSAKPADAVTITGTNFNTTAANNIVFFGATKANVTAATATSLTVTVPTGATYAPITVLNTGTTSAAYSKANFNPIYSPAKTAITTSDFSPKQDFATGSLPISVAIGDLDGDGKPDLAVANSSNSVSVLRNTSTSGSIGSGSFAAKVDFATGAGPNSVAIGDLDGDGKPDLAVANYDVNTVSVLRNTSTSGSTSFAAKVDFATGTGPISVAIGDLDGDGKPDLAVANRYENTVYVLRNTSTSGSITSGSFAAMVDFATGAGPNSVAIGDLDGDGKPDLAVANSEAGVNTVSVLRNTSTSGSIGSDSFAAKVDFATGTSPSSVAIGDLDGDGKPDLATANIFSNEISVLRNTSTSGSTSFATKVDFATGALPYSVAIGDLDGDGKPDLATANYDANTVSVLRNTSTIGSIGSGSFAAKVDFATGTGPNSVAIGDLDGDGKPDLATANNGSNMVSVLRNADIVPTITSFSPLSAKPADAVTITGTNFNTTAANNIVFFGATKANVTAATATSLTVTVPTGATYAPITVLNTGTTLAAYSKANFNPIYSPAKTAITTSDFSPKQDFATGTVPISVAIGDLDGDGKPDLAVANYTSNSVSVLRNTSTSGSIGSGSFAAKEDFATGTGPYSVAIGDLDGDGKPDLAVANYTSNSVSVLRNTSTSGSITSGSFAAKEDFATGTRPISVAIGDLDGDGKPDLAVANNGTGVNTVSVLRNTSTSGSIGSGSFAAKEDFATGTGPYSVAIGDLDGDGKPDLAVANYDVNTVSVLRNTSTSGSIGSGSFAAKEDFATGTGPYSVAIGDLDGDGKPDLATANYDDNTVSVLRNTSTSGSIGSGSFAAKVDFATGTSPSSVAIGDLDGDGKPDLAVANYTSNSVSVLRNTSTSGSIGSGSFAAKVDFATGSLPYSVAIGDLDGDGKPDLAVANNGSNMVSVLRNADIATPTITVSTARTPLAFTACAGAASAQQFFTVRGSNLTNNITVTAPAGFEISTVNNSGFATTPITLTQSGGNVSFTNIYVRMAATATGTPSGNVTCASSGATDKTVAVSGTANTNPSVVINKSSSSICVGATLTLTASAPLPELAGLAPDIAPVSSDGYAWASSGGTFVSSTGSPGSTGSPISWSSGSSGGVTFTVTATNSNNCSATATATVLVNENPSVSISPLPSSICVGATLNLTASPPNPVSAGLSPDANPVFSDGYAWASSGGTFNSSAATATFSSSSAGGFNFTVTATNTNSCSATATASVTVGNPNIIATPINPICAGVTINLAASGGISYSWVHSGGGNFSSTTNPVTFNSSSAGGFGFTVTATVSGGCTATATTSVSVKANPSVVITPSATSVCVGKSINLNASTPLPQSAGLAPFVPLPSDGYAWASSGGTFVSSTSSPVSWSSNSSGTFSFTVTATNTNSCSASATATVRVNENPTVSISPPTSSLCVGATLNLTASPPNPVSAGLSPSITPVSSDGYAWASSGGTFNSSAATATFSSSSAGGFSFTVTATNSNSCSATATASVTVGGASITAMPPTSICAGATINLTASGGISYSWVHSGGGNFVSSTNPVTFSSSSAGGFSFTVTATVSGGCTATATTSLSVKAKPTVSINSPSSVCVGKSINLSASTPLPQSAGLAPTISVGDSYTWASSGGNFVSSTNPATFSSNSAGGFSFTVTATNSNNCSATATASVRVNENPSVSISPGTSSLCTGQTLELRASPPNPSSAGLSGVSVSSDSYTWASSGGGTFVSSTNPATFSSNIAGGFRFTVTASNSNSCSATATASATVNTKPALAISQSNNQVCAGVSINLTATSGLSNYSWVHSGGTFTSTTNEARFSSGAGGTFTFTVTAGNSTCSNSATTTVLVYGVSSANLSFAPICALGNPLNLSASGGGSYSWRGPNGFKSSSATPSKAKTVAKDEGIYSVTVSSTLGCTSTSTIKVYVGVGKITATSNSTVCKGGTIQLSATAEFGASYKWTKQFSSVTYQGQNPTIPNAQPSNGGVYLVFVTGVNGCVVKEEVLVVVSSRACTSGRLASGEEVEGMELEVNTYPNPTSKLVTVEVKLAKPSSLNLQLFNATGNTLTEWNLSEESTIHRKEIDLSAYKDGLYLIQAQSKDGKQTKRVMKIE